MWHAIETVTDVGFLWFEIGCCIYPYLYPREYLIHTVRLDRVDVGDSYGGRPAAW